MFLPIHATRQYSARFMATFFLALLLRTPFLRSGAVARFEDAAQALLRCTMEFGSPGLRCGHLIVALAGNTRARCAVHLTSKQEVIMGRGILLWLLGVPIPIIILLFLFFR